MQASDMATFRLLRSQLHHFNFPNYSIFRNRHHQNPKISRHFSPPLNPQFIHSINLKQSPESPLLVVNSQAKQTPSNSPPREPISDKNPNSWSVFSSTGTNPKISNSVEESVEDRRNTVSKSSLGKGKKGKVNWVCSDCGHSEGQWWGICKSCKKVGTLEPFSVAENSEKRKLSGIELSENAMRSWLPQQKGGHSGPVRLSDVNRGINDSDWRIQLSGIFGAEVARVLGGGIVPGSLTLVGGDPGVGKSTLLLQLAALIAESCNGAAPVVYISGEESVEQIGNRADRLNIDTEDLYLYSGTDVEDILEKVQPFCPCALIIDSIQTVYLKGVAGSPGGPVQLKECTAALLRFSKKTNIPVLLIGHVTKCGDIAGPRVLEHIVDSVLYMEGEKHSTHRLLRSVKNRFGSTDELGVFEMLESGLQAVVNPSAMFLSEEHSNSEHLAGLAVAVIIDGSRTFLVEVQALCVADSVGKHYNGVVASRAEMIISVLKKQAGLKMQDYSVFLNVVSGLSLTETSGDLAVAAAICSSFLEVPIPNHAAFIGEIGLGGELRTVPRIDKRVTTLAKLGYKTCIVPKLAEKALVGLRFQGLQVVGCENLKEVIDSLQKMRK
ncbi:uncharacterized protein LOC104903728 isoform X1 [Beta vulgaris subsp. vulgaris]|uniref:uncharacterized protein LOC104903728 isoform X1 n=1 Tax=Beta vulgaris subsp. vulgaris TaxID=3555 RepID=UPI002036EFDA|nr:uncharacterized protein LOC104903728 isoform X1 [Beta vulgaris subsp. vulgaris]